MLYTSSGDSSPLILKSPPPPSGVTIPSSSYASLSCHLFIFPLLYVLVSILFLFGFHLFYFPYMLFNFATIHQPHLILCVFPLLSRSEPSHLLNHLVKFMSSGNLLWVSHHILLKIKNHKQSATHKNVQF